MNYKDFRYVLPLGLWVFLRRLFFKKKLDRQINLIYNGKHGIAKIAYSEELNILFIHIPKTGGTAICKSVLGFFPRAHFTPREFCEIFGWAKYNSSIKFTFVRNPWDRFYSAYNYLLMRKATENNNKWADKNYIEGESFNDFIKRNAKNTNLFDNIMFRPQHYFIKDKDLVMIDYLCYYEQIDDHLQFLCNKFGITSQKLEYYNQNNMGFYKDKYTPETIQIISDLYKTDIELFKYDFMNTIIPKNPICFRK